MIAINPDGTTDASAWHKAIEMRGNAKINSSNKGIKITTLIIAGIILYFIIK